VSHLPGFDRVHEREVVAADLFGPVPERKKRRIPVAGVVVLERTGKTAREADCGTADTGS
jgi:hypothetical protein